MRIITSGRFSKAQPLFVTYFVFERRIWQKSTFTTIHAHVEKEKREVNQSLLSQTWTNPESPPPPPKKPTKNLAKNKNNKNKTKIAKSNMANQKREL